MRGGFKARLRLLETLRQTFNEFPQRKERKILNEIYPKSCQYLGSVLCGKCLLSLSVNCFCMQRGKQSDDCVHYWRPASEKKIKVTKKKWLKTENKEIEIFIRQIKLKCTFGTQCWPLLHFSIVIFSFFAQVRFFV